MCRKKPRNYHNLNSILGYLGFPCGAVVKNLPSNPEDTRDMGSIPEWGRSPGGGNDNPFQYSCLENLIDRGVWQASVHGLLAKSDKTKQLSMSVCMHTHTHTHLCYLGDFESIFKY